MATPQSRPEVSNGRDVLSHGWKWVAFPAALGSVLLGLSLLGREPRESLLASLSCMLGIAPLVLFYLYQRHARQRNRAEQTLRESEERYRLMVELSPNGVVACQDSRIVYSNEAAAKLLGASMPKELAGKPVLDFVHSESRPAIEKLLRHVIELGAKQPVEEVFQRLDGSKRGSGSNGNPALGRGRTGGATGAAGRDRAQADQRSVAYQRSPAQRRLQLAHRRVCSGSGGRLHPLGRGGLGWIGPSARRSGRKVRVRCVWKSTSDLTQHPPRAGRGSLLGYRERGQLAIRDLVSPVM